MAQDIFIGGVPFTALGHHDGRFVRTAGLFAFARREPSGAYQVLHLEMTDAINRSAASDHPRWAWALRQGMDSLLVHLFGRSADLPQSAGFHTETVLWHPDAKTHFGLDESAPDVPEDGQIPGVPGVMRR